MCLEEKPIYQLFMNNVEIITRQHVWSPTTCHPFTRHAGFVWERGGGYQKEDELRPDLRSHIPSSIYIEIERELLSQGPKKKKRKEKTAGYITSKGEVPPPGVI